MTAPLNYNESAGTLYRELEAAYRQQPLHINIYKGYADVFQRVILQNTQFLTIHFNGIYARTSYLLKEHGASRELTKMVNGVRSRIREFSNGKAEEDGAKDAFLEELAANYRYDFEALCRFIALVYEEEIPAEMSQQFLPPRQVQDTLSSPPESNTEADCLRLIVTRWDDRYIYGTADGMDDEVTVAYTHRFQGKEQCEWSYVREMLFENCQLNLVRPHWKKRDAGGALESDVLVPELIVFEPDYLVNISEIAHCFQPGAVTEHYHLLRKIQSNTHTEATILGNFAGQILDEEINRKSGELTYAESVNRFFRQNALAMLATDISADFHLNAKAQQRNIHNAFAGLPAVVHGYDRSKVVLEPSFFSQMLGVQGRVDLMQQDYRFLVEQKSGKCAFPYPTHPGEAPMPQEQHYVQILLYMMIMRYNFRSRYEANQRNFSCFLLYSKYPASLCNVDWAPELMFKAMRIRNAIVAADYGYAANGFGVLADLKPEHFRQRPVPDKLWLNYLELQLRELLAPIHSVSTLERKYFNRMLTFVANEHLLAKVGSNQREDHGLASIWLNTLEEKRQAGNIYTRLRLLSPSPEKHEDGTPVFQGSVTDVVLAIEEKDDERENTEGMDENGMSNFRVGDIVILYPYVEGTCPDACSTMIIRCSVSEINSERIILHLRAPQSDARIFTDTALTPTTTDGGQLPRIFWAVEHDFMESSFSSQYQGVYSFLTTTADRRNLLLLQRPPETDETRRLNGDYGSFNTLALRVKQAKDLFLIIGPPGTGKTSYGMLNTLKEQLTEAGTSVLITSYTNRAVDEICSKLVEEGIDFIRLGSALSADPAYAEYHIDSKVNECRNINALRQAIRQARVIIGTTTALSGRLDVFTLKCFDLLIIDEASQILEPHLLPILCARNGENSSEVSGNSEFSETSRTAVRKIVMIGDHKQLPAVVQQSAEESKVTDPDLLSVNLKDCRLSLFERFLSKYGDNPAVTFMLTKQGRMHQDIAAFPNQAFYEGKLQVVPLRHQLVEIPASSDILSRRIAFVPVVPDLGVNAVSDKVNQQEADVIAAMVVDIYKKVSPAFKANETIGVIVPYRNQISTVRNTIAAYGIEALNDITIDTVERYQGSQRDYVIFGFTIKKYYQLQFLTNNTFEENGQLIDRKLNVAMTRAREHLFLVGNPKLLSRNPVYHNLLDFIRERGGVMDCR